VEERRNYYWRARRSRVTHVAITARLPLLYLAYCQSRVNFFMCEPYLNNIFIAFVFCAHQTRL
jgi:hypothetical protein